MDSACASSSSPCASSSKKFSSNIWNFFDIIEIILENNKKEIKAKCKICSKLLSGGSNSGTSCHTLIPGPTRLADPNRVRGARPYTGTLYLFFFFLKSNWYLWV